MLTTQRADTFQNICYSKYLIAKKKTNKKYMNVNVHKARYGVQATINPRVTRETKFIACS